MIKYYKYILKSFSLKSHHNFSTYDPYYILGVEKSSDFDIIKKAYYKLASEFHPDKNKTLGAQK
jgi:DnaJ-class molecular chaperone